MEVVFGTQKFNTSESRRFRAKFNPIQLPVVGSKFLKHITSNRTSENSFGQK